jgi:hypothetical protein
VAETAGQADVSTPMAVRRMRIVVSGGSTMSMSGMSLWPTIEMSAGQPRA